MNKNEFLRQLTLQMPEAESGKAFTLLAMKGIEVYGSEYHILEEPAADGIFYVSAADREMAVQILQDAGLGSYVSESKKVQSESEEFLEKAEKEYYRKRKITLYECLVVILAALLYYLIRS